MASESEGVTYISVIFVSYMFNWALNIHFLVKSEHVKCKPDTKGARKLLSTTLIDSLYFFFFSLLKLLYFLGQLFCSPLGGP